MRLLSNFYFVVCALIMLWVNQSWAIGESAVITLVFPPGARATGLGETFTGIADDVNATYFNPAGLGQTPLANAWKSYPNKNGRKLTAIVAKKHSEFGVKEYVWVGTTNGLIRFNGKVWEDYETYVIEQGDNILSIAGKYIVSDDENLVKQAVLTIRDVNGIDQKKRHLFNELLSPVILGKDSVERSEKLQSLIFNLLALKKDDRTVPKVYGLLSAYVDSSITDSLSEKLAKVYEVSDVSFEDLVELKIPFSIAIKDTVTSLTLDASDRLWVGTTRGLWNYNEKTWNHHSIIDGLPSNNVTTVAVSEYGEIAAGTDSGLALLSDGLWKNYTKKDGLPASYINCVTFGKNKELFIGTNNGLAEKQDSGWTILDTSTGLLSEKVTALCVDDDNNLWAGGDGGVSRFTGTSWKRYKFPQSKVTSISEYRKGQMWIGTDKGAITYKASANPGNPPIWKAYHSKNGLDGNIVKDVTAQGKDVWLTTDKSINQYDHADLQFLFFYEPLLPAFGIDNLWHIYVAGVLPTDDWGTIGLSFNYLSFGENTWTDELGRELGEARSWEGVLALSYGIPIKEDFSFGMNIKYAHSALAPGFGPNDEGVGRTMAFDASLLKQNLFIKNLSLGFMMQNMGPSIFYISRDEADPIPFTLRLGLAYQIFQTPIHDLKIAVDFDREVVKNYVDKRPDPFWKALYTDLIKMDENDNKGYWEKAKSELGEVTAHIGLEWWYVHFLALRLGYMHDKAGSRKELSLGVGLRYGKLGVDWSYIHAPSGSIARHGQWRLSLLVKI